MSREAKKQHASAYSGLCDHYSDQDERRVVSREVNIIDSQTIIWESIHDYYWLFDVIPLKKGKRSRMHAHAYSGLCDHYSGELFTRMVGLKF